MTKRILVIDDELDIRDVVCLSLEEFGGWQTAAAASGGDGLAQARAGTWDAILLDVSMPDMDGFAVYADGKGAAQRSRSLRRPGGSRGNRQTL
jgi:CheY-like chemotaxis protein